MLDPDDGDAFAANLVDRLDQRADLPLGQAASDLVEQQEARARRKRARQFEPLAVEQRQRAGLVVDFRHEPGAFDDVEAHALGLFRRESCAERRADEHVFVDGHLRERMRNLIRPPDAAPATLGRRERRDVLAAEHDASRIRPDPAADQVEQRRLAGAVGSDDPDSLSLSDGEGEVVGDLQRTVSLADAFDLEKGRRRGHSSSSLPWVGILGASVLLTTSEVEWIFGALAPLAADERRLGHVLERPLAAELDRPDDRVEVGRGTSASRIAGVVDRLRALQRRPPRPRSGRARSRAAASIACRWPSRKRPRVPSRCGRRART